MEVLENEPDLIRELKKGSRKAFELIYQMYSKRLYVYSLQLTKSKEDSEEIVQDVFVRLWTNREKIYNEESLRSLLYIMAKHYFLNAYRSKVNSPIYEEYVTQCDERLSENIAEYLEYEEFEKRFHRWVEQLPLTQQKIIKLSKLEGMSNKGVADILSLSEQTVKNQLSLALKTLRERFKNTICTVALLSVNFTYFLGTIWQNLGHYYK